MEKVRPKHSAIMCTQSAASYLGIGHSSLAKLRMEGRGPQFVRISRRRIGYRREDLDQYLESRLRHSTVSDRCPYCGAKPSDHGHV